MKQFLLNNIKYVVLVLAIACIVTGLLSGAAAEVYEKAKMICLECCGIG